MKKSEKTLKSYSGGYVATILEEIRDDFKAFGDGQKLLTDRVNKIDIRLSEVEDRTSRNGIKLIAIAGDLRELKRDNKDSFKSSLEYLSRIENEIISMKKEAEIMEKTVSKKADKEKIRNFEERLIKLEKLVFSKLV